ncbi:TOMM system kinase/cyclase fusion protein [Pseudoalteromonas sp. MMG012]|uniref:TOMM system kinase/cyclase fusion protein n=1 Tax=Pseudoalteromonas sp. MMG012 TaxID=2822686 RepID=UPI001B3A0E32|nr:TOMM system kinase/cyclase fusion protein [Pseudoalteromonas sp. MMG012]MBQ4850220.1 TOMM system kinase/cyclase fusion protein [Pseudoalteromonas sp. MMG012]
MSLTQFSDQFITDSFDSAHYELIHKIGEGGFGKVFKARHKNTNQFVAIKFLALEPHLEEQKKRRYIERFKRETQLSSQLQHPHIVRLLDKGQVDEHLLYGVFEYVDGISLRQHLTQEGALNAVDATDVMLQVLDALIHAHSRGIIHRDIKPANIMLAKSGAKTYAKILDFGIGTLVSEHRQPDFNTLTLTQETLGTPSYSAPEQLRGEPATTKTDLYVWGLVYLECLTGLPAVTGSSIASIYHKQLSDINVPLPAPLLGHPLASLLRRVLKKNAIDRVITSQESFNELNSINVANLVGILTKGEAQHGFDDDTVILRKDAEGDQGNHHTLLTERKQITVLALKISISEISDNTKDLDVIDALTKAQLNQCIDIATRFNAYHVGTLGDMLLFYFGFPIASDNDTRLSARTALEIMSEMSKRDALMQDVHGISFNIHIGLHTGVFVTYANAIPEGHITNSALTLARSAKPKQILCSGDSRAILEPYSEFETIDFPTLKQPGSPATVYSLKGERQVEAFGFMRGTRNNHELIGREKELDKTLSIVQQSQHNTRIAHIHGEAGIGKSRLLQEIRSHAGQYQHLVAQCLPEHQNNALYPVLTLIRYLFNTAHLDVQSAIALFSDIIQKQDQSVTATQAMPILLIWLNIELPEDMQASTLAPDQQKIILFNSLTALLLNQQYSISENKLYIIEDIHWADTTTIEFIQHFAGQLDTGNVLISTSRQQVPTSLKDLTLLEVNLNKLTAQATEDFIIKLFDNQPVSRNVLDILTSRTDGIPLFIEELVGMLKQKALVGLVEGEINFVSPDKLDQVPSSLRESLQQKLDSLIHAKETAQLAATIGREFEYELLISASSLSENQIQNDLNELIANDLIIQQRRVNNDSYIFKHALVRDAAYESMDRNAKEKSHYRIARTLSEIYDNHNEGEPLVISTHMYKANLYSDATKYRIFAIEKLVKNSAHNSAIEIGDEALKWIANSHSHDGVQYNELDLHKAMLPSIMTLFGYGADRVLSWGNRVQSIINQESIDKKTFFEMNKKSKWTLFMSAHYASHRVKARNLGEQLLLDIKESGTRQDLVVVLVHLAQAYNIDGDLLNASKLYEQALHLYDEDSDDILAQEYGMNIKVQILSLASYNYLHLGELKIAKKYAYDSLEYSERLESIGEIVFANIFIALYHIFLKQHDVVSNNWHNFQLKYSSDATGNVFHLHFLECYSYSSLRDTSLARKALNKQIETGQTFAAGYYVTHLAEAYIEQGSIDAAIDLMTSSLEICENQGELSVIPFIKKTLAQCLFSKRNQLDNEILALLHSSIESAKSQNAKFFELENRYYLYSLTQKKADLDALMILFNWFTNTNQVENSQLFNDIEKLL